MNVPTSAAPSRLAHLGIVGWLIASALAAMPLWASAATNAGGDPQARFRKGVELMDQKRSLEAIALFQKLAADFPSLPEPQNNLAVLYAERGEPEKARAALEAALRGRPSYDAVYRNLVLVNSRLSATAYARALNIDDSKTLPSRLAPIANLDDSMSAALPSAPLALAPSAAMPTTPATIPAAAPAATKTAPPVTLAAASSPVAAPAASSATAMAAAAASAAAAKAAKPAASSASAVAPTPAASAVAAAPAASATPKPADTGSETAAISEAVRNWAAAWARRDIPAYFGAYVQGFQGTESSPAEWQASRRERILGKKNISVGVSNVVVSVNKSQKSATFIQTYTADQLKLVNRKTLDFEFREGRWLITHETSSAIR